MKHPIVSRIPSLGLLLVLMSCGESGGPPGTDAGETATTEAEVSPIVARGLALELDTEYEVPPGERSITTLRVSPTLYVLRSFSRAWIRSMRPQMWVGSRLPSTRDTTWSTRSSTSSGSW